MKIFIIGFLVASATMVSAQGLLNRGNRPNRLGRNTGVNAAASRMPSSTGVSTKEADELAEKIAAPEMQGRIKGILDEPTPVKLEEFPFREAVMKAKAGDAEGYFALAYHYAVGKEVASDDVKAKLFLKKAAGSNYPLGILILAMVEEMRLLEIHDYSSRLSVARSEPRIEKYLLDYSQRSGYLAGFSSRSLSVEEFNELSATEPFFKEFSWDTTRLQVSNPADISYVRGLYEKSVELKVPGAKSELNRFEDCIVGSAGRVAKDRCQQSNAQFAKDELGIPMGYSYHVWLKVMKENERTRQNATEERLSAIEQQLREKGLLK